MDNLQREQLIFDFISSKIKNKIYYTIYICFFFLYITNSAATIQLNLNLAKYLFIYLYRSDNNKYL